VPALWGCCRLFTRYDKVAWERGVWRIGKVAFASFIGTAIEFYDFYIYGTAAALVFESIFFPEFAPATGTLASFATFAVAFRRGFCEHVLSHHLLAEEGVATAE
jgi:hypothetical protein